MVSRGVRIATDPLEAPPAFDVLVVSLGSPSPKGESKGE